MPCKLRSNSPIAPSMATELSRRHGIARNWRKKSDLAGDEKLVVRFSERDCIMRHYTISPSCSASSQFSTSQLVSPNISGSSMQYRHSVIVQSNRKLRAYLPNTRVQSLERI